MRSSLIYLLIASLGTGVATVHAQTIPDAGSLQRETGRNLQPPPVAEQPAALPAMPLPMHEAKAVRVTVRQLVIDGATLIPAAELAASLNDIKGQSLTLAELEQAAQRIVDLYRARGWFARVYLPQQDVTAGTIHIQVLEGRYGGSQLETPAQRAQGAFVQDVVTHRLVPGQPLSAADLERGLLLANDLPGIRAYGLLEPGSVAGETRLKLRVEDTSWLTGDLAASNYGIKTTGRAQLVGGVALNNLTGNGDQLSLRGLAADHLWNVQARYSLPLGVDGWRLAGYYSTLDYRLGDAFAPLNAQGAAKTTGVSLSYPLLRQTERNLNLITSYEQRRYSDDMLNTGLHRHHIDVLSLGLSGDLRDNLGGLGAAVSWGSLQLVQGRLDIRDIVADQAMDAVGPRTRGDYTKLVWQLQRQQALSTSQWQIHTEFAGQMSSHNLASSERFILGGPGGVRAYPVNEASGDEGLLFRIELQRALATNWQAKAFYDAGYVRLHHQPWAGWQAGGNLPNSYGLAGAGLGLGWRNGNWQLDFSVAAPLGNNPGRDMLGRNNDGSRASAIRSWLTLSCTF